MVLILENNKKNLRNNFYCIVVYDVKEKRVQKVNKIFKKFLTHKQNSVFIGELKKAEFIELENELRKIINEEEDEICFFTVKNKSDLEQIELGFDDQTKNELFF